MTAKIIDGVAIAKKLRAEYAERVRVLAGRGVVPGLALIVVGDDPGSKVYVRNKINACRDIGMHSQVHAFAQGCTEDEVLACIRTVNADPSIHGLLVQLPVPPHFDMPRILQTVSRAKDVDGFHLYNVGSLVFGRTVFPPCTPFGVQRLLEYEGIAVEGKSVVVVGASNIVGKPMAMMMLQKDATVTICHVKTRDLAQYTILADILIVAAGRPNLILPQMVKTGAVVIDVGINRLPDGRLVGDVDFEGVRQKASHITPVPGGVGPMTVTMLLQNTIAAAEREADPAPLEEADFHDFERAIA
jgi:methylenetetrahydrofolate dehydrogenase (NADP+) / methenyltetrahydrofolate cyclohydrolase